MLRFLRTLLHTNAAVYGVADPAERKQALLQVDDDGAYVAAPDCSGQQCGVQTERLPLH